MKHYLLGKKRLNRLVPVAAVMALSAGGPAQVHAASCNALLQSHINWLETTPSGYSRDLGLVMVSNEAGVFNLTKFPQATYLAASLGVSSYLGVLTGKGNALFNDRRWGPDPDCGSARDLCLKQDIYPFDPEQGEKWTVMLNHGNSMMILTRGGKTYQVPIDCDGNLMVGTYTTYGQYGSYKFPFKTTKYVLSLYRNEVALPK